ncbi:MAG: hypothetical protein ACR2NB_06925 [Solirubrobacteraceae bacterium]
MPTPEEIEAAAGIAPAGEEDRKRIWAAAQAHAAAHGGGPGAEDLQLAERMLRAAGDIGGEHLAQGLGRATITLLDTAGSDEEIDVSVEFSPQLEEMGEGEVAGTPAQLLAIEVLEGAFGEESDGHRPVGQ